MSRDGTSTHYDAGGIEAYDIIEAKLTPDQFKGWLLGNALKYNLRMMHKGYASSDAKKARFYSTWLDETLNPKEEQH